VFRCLRLHAQQPTSRHVTVERTHYTRATHTLHTHYTTHTLHNANNMQRGKTKQERENTHRHKTDGTGGNTMLRREAAPPNVRGSHIEARSPSPHANFFSFFISFFPPLSFGSRTPPAIWHAEELYIQFNSF